MWLDALVNYLTVVGYPWHPASAPAITDSNSDAVMDGDASAVVHEDEAPAPVAVADGEASITPMEGDTTADLTDTEPVPLPNDTPSGPPPDHDGFEGLRNLVKSAAPEYDEASAALTHGWPADAQVVGKDIVKYVS